ncbi:MAG: dockerin type I repeat-containing protein [Prevotella sp.]|nr:dockerin type I repeat-containing protein [Prevotella sp.]
MRPNHLIVSLLLLGLCSIARGQTGYYWFDEDFGDRTASSVSNGTINVDVSGLSTGFHTLRYFYRSRQGEPSSTYSKGFFVQREMKGVKAEYWFDSNYAGRVTTSTVSGAMSVNVSTLSNGMHTLHYQQISSSGVPSSVYSHPFFVQKEAKGVKAEYWFDSNYAGRVNTTTVSGPISIDVSALPTGMHTLHYQQLDATGAPTSVYSCAFFAQKVAKGVKAEYWFDSDYAGRVNTTTVSGTMTIDASALKTGMHTLHYQQLDATGAPTSVYSCAFFAQKVAKGVKAEYWFDSDYAGRVNTTTVSGTMTIDASALKTGMHALHYQQLDATGAPTSVYSCAFFVQKEVKATKAEYWFDGNYDARRPLGISSMQTIDLSTLSAGFHALHYQALSSEGTPTSVYTKLFWIPASAAPISSYHYWVNDLTDKMKSVTLATPTLPWKLTTAFDVPTAPIRTQKFHFEVLDDNTPMVYAKNTFNLVLAGTDGTSTRVEHDYVDYRTGEQVYAKLLAHGEQRTVDITGYLQWFRVSVTRGDSIAFRANRNCTMHLFSPTGEQLWEVSGDAAKKWNGTHATQSGSYYMVLHDVTDSGATDVMVSYYWEGTPALDGDVNADGSVGIGDIVAVTNVMAGITNDADTVARADVNGDGSVGIGDIVAITNIMAGQATARQQ